MDEAKPSLLKCTLNYGIMLGMALIIFNLVLWMFNAITNQYLGYLALVINIAGIVLATKNYRDQVQGGHINYGRALGVGTLTAVFSGVILSVFTYLLYGWIDPGLVERIHLTMEEAMYESGMSYDQIEAAMKIAVRFNNPIVMSIMGIVNSAFLGFIFSLITSIFLKKEEDIFESEAI